MKTVDAKTHRPRHSGPPSELELPALQREYPSCAGIRAERSSTNSTSACATSKRSTRRSNGPDSLKQAVDLNTRMLAEQSFISIELARLQSMQLMLLATAQNGTNSGTATRAEFLRAN